MDKLYAMKFSEVVPKLFIIGAKDFSFSKELQSFVKDFSVSGLALFNSPFDNPLNIWQDRDSALEQVYDFIYRASPLVNFLAADQEGGRVRRLRRPFVHLPSAEVISNAFQNENDLITIKELYRLSAEQMALSQIRLNFAPVCDLKTPKSSNVVGDRSYGEKIDDILPLIEAFCRAYEESGVHTTLKHFPGHGPTELDSHEHVALLFKSKKELFNEDRSIFLKASAYASAILTAHVAFQEEPNRIFSLDQKLIEEFKVGLPKELAWITDDLLSMKAVSDKQPWNRALDAGYDFILLCGSLEDSARAIEDTIRYSESNTKSFQQEQELEKRAERSSRFFNTKSKLDSFSVWKSKILELEDRGNHCLEKLKIKIA